MDVIVLIVLFLIALIVIALVVLIVVLSHIGTTAKQPSRPRASIVRTDSSFVILSKNQIEAFLDMQLLKFGSLSHNHLTLLTGHIGLFQQKLALNFIGNFDAVLLDLPQLFIVLGDEAEKSLTWLSRHMGKVPIEIL